ncbi:MAG: hypothetical protein IKO23_09555 [Bacteroidales bacterium]|nr:hypothetical protein [Bacteroidales bacterium]
MSGKKRYRSTKKRIRAIVAIVNEEYQPGDQNHCYKAIWRRRILPEFGVCYNTFLSYLGVSPSELEEEQPKNEDTNQLSLFDL